MFERVKTFRALHRTTAVTGLLVHCKSNAVLVRLSGFSCVRYWSYSNVSARTAVAMFRVNEAEGCYGVRWILGRDGMQPEVRSSVFDDDVFGFYYQKAIQFASSVRNVFSVLRSTNMMPWKLKSTFAISTKASHHCLYKPRFGNRTSV
jgi:hypothetical protein